MTRDISFSIDRSTDRSRRGDEETGEKERLRCSRKRERESEREERIGTGV